MSVRRSLADKSAPEEVEEEGVTDREGAGQEESSSARASASRARIRSSSSMSAMTMGLDRSTSSCSLFSFLPPVSDSSIWRIWLCFFHSARSCFETMLRVGPSVASAATAGAEEEEPVGEVGFGLGDGVMRVGGMAIR
jgi:hypothetical protein